MKMCLGMLVLFSGALSGQQDSIALRFSRLINAEDLKRHLEIFAGDKFEGREAGQKGQKKAAKYLSAEFKKAGAHPPGDTSWYQKFEIQGKGKDSTGKGTEILQTENVIAVVEGNELKNEVIIISAHYDHLGIRGKTVYNGADDDGSGSVALLELAQAFSAAKKNGYGPKRTLVFIGFSAEEKGLLGSKHYVSHPVWKLEHTACNLNIDMIGRIDKHHAHDSHYVYVIGADKISTRLHNLNEEANYLYTKLTLDYRYNDLEDKNRFYYRSDHYNFAKNGVPVIFYFNGTHEDYHRESDEVDKISFSLLEQRTRLIFHTTWMVANSLTPITRNLSKP